MNKIKDFIYDKNDLLIALLIVAVAAYIILAKIDVIMAYPQTLIAEGSAGSGNIMVTPPDTSVKPPKTLEGDGRETEADPGQTEVPPDTGDDNPPTSSQTTGEPTISQVSIYIEYGATGSEIAQLLIDSGLIDSKQVFYDAVTAAGADTRLQAGNFKIPSNANPAEIIKIITN
jgi:hypothetical protein